MYAIVQFRVYWYLALIITVASHAAVNEAFLINSLHTKTFMRQRERSLQSTPSLNLVTKSINDNVGSNSNSEIIRNGTIATNMNSTTSRVGSLHFVNGIAFREVPMNLPLVGTVTILEATSESQEELVDMALLLDEEIEEASQYLSKENKELKQELKKGDPYGAVLWPAAWAVARHLLLSTQQSPKLPLQGLSILELGTGTGLVSLAAALGGADRVFATDYEDLALLLTRYAADNFHSSISPAIETCLVDLCDTTPLPPADIVVAADVMYEPQTGIALAHRVVEALDRGSRVIIGDSPGRAGRPNFLETLQQLGVEDASFVETVGRTCTGPRHELICGKGSKSVSETEQDLEVAIMDLIRGSLR